MRVAFRVAADAHLGPGYHTADDWADPPTPPPGQEDRNRLSLSVREITKRSTP